MPRLALSNPVLYYSCLAYAARVLNLRRRFHATKAEYYYNEAISLMIPLLDPKSQAVSTDILTSTTVLLRMSEQFSEPDEDAQCHMNGAFSVFKNAAPTWSPNRVDVQGVSFWIFVRQTLRICFLFEQDCRFDLGIVDSSNILDPAGDEVWANRMTFHLANVCNACWSSHPEDSRSEQHLKKLENDITAWRQALPETFRPWFYQQKSDEPFPTIRYLSRWHGTYDTIQFESTNILIFDSHRMAAVLHCQNNARYSASKSTKFENLSRNPTISKCRLLDIHIEI